MNHMPMAETTVVTPAIEAPVVMSPRRPPIIATPPGLGWVGPKEAKPLLHQAAHYGLETVVVHYHKNNGDSTLGMMLSGNGWVSEGEAMFIQCVDMLNINRDHESEVLGLLGT